jgi:transposase
MSRHALSDREWTRLEPLLPKRRTGRPPKDHRTIIDALLWLDRTGAPWRDLPERFGRARSGAMRLSAGRQLPDLRPARRDSDGFENEA